MMRKGISVAYGVRLRDCGAVYVVDAHLFDLSNLSLSTPRFTPNKRHLLIIIYLTTWLNPVCFFNLVFYGIRMNIDAK